MARLDCTVHVKHKYTMQHMVRYTPHSKHAHWIKIEEIHKREGRKRECNIHRVQLLSEHLYGESKLPTTMRARDIVAVDCTDS